MITVESERKEKKGGVELESFIDKTNGLYELSKRLNWDYLVKELGEYYVENNGRPGISIRVLAGLHYLKYLENESDETIVEKFCENPYWQYFCGFKTFQHELPCHPTTLVKWRKKVGIEGIEKLLTETINTAKREALLPEKLCAQVNVDTTVQEKAITFPTDGKLCYKLLKKLIEYSQDKKISLRQSYVRVSKFALLNQQRYAHARQMKRANKALRKLKTYLGRVMRELARKILTPCLYLQNLLELGQRLLSQKRDSANKIYSLHAPEVECIAKGKARVKYEFGCKVSIVTTCIDPWVISIAAVHGNPYDGATLKESIAQAQNNTLVTIQKAFVDKGYRGKEYHPKETQVFISGTKNLPYPLKKLLRARSAIEPIIGHLKQDHRLNKNFLLGKIGDMINTTLAGAAFNLKKIIRLSQPIPSF